VGGVRACVVCIVVCYMHVYAYFRIPRFPVFPGSLPRFPTAWGRRVGVGGVGGGGLVGMREPIDLGIGEHKGNRGTWE
jgi:hypothetical protein